MQMIETAIPRYMVIGFEKKNPQVLLYCTLQIYGQNHVVLYDHIDQVLEENVLNQVFKKNYSCVLEYPSSHPISTFIHKMSFEAK